MSKAKGKTKSKASLGKLHAPKVFVRIRPNAATGGHQALGGDAVEKQLHAWTEKTVSLKDRHEITNYDFPTKVFTPESSQQQVYDDTLPEVLEEFTKKDGTNILYFAYGQTGTGKTHTMFGTEESLKSSTFHQDWGMFPRTAAMVLEKMNSSSTRFVLEASAIEFYMMSCFDVLKNKEPCQLDDAQRPIGMKTMRIREIADAMSFLSIVTKNRTTHGTNMNEGSSRSHCALVLTLTQMDIATTQVTQTSFKLLDLAGAERPDKTGGQRISAMEAMIECAQGKKVSTGASGVIINFELSGILSEIISVTEKYKQNMKHTARNQLSTPAMLYISACLEGTAMLNLIVCLSQAPQHGWETWFSLNYGTNFKALQAPMKSQKSDKLDKLMKKFKKELDVAVEKLSKTPQTGSPASKYYGLRSVTVSNIKHWIEILNEFNGDATSLPKIN